MANIGYRRFNGTTDALTVNLGNIASASSLDCWIFAGRLVSAGGDAELVHSAGYDPLDLYLATGFIPDRVELYDGAVDTGTEVPDGGVTWTPADGFVILAVRRVASTVVRWSKAVYSGSWGTFTHSNGLTTFGNRSYPASGVLTFAASNPLNADFALMARTTSSSDADIATLTTDAASWSALPNITNLWRFDGGTVVDLQGTATQNALTGTSVTANGFPLDDNAGAPTYVRPTIVTPTVAAQRASRW